MLEPRREERRREGEWEVEVVVGVTLPLVCVGVGADGVMVVGLREGERDGERKGFVSIVAVVVVGGMWLVIV